MIKKSVFEDELIAGMQKELIKNASEDHNVNLSKAVDYLNSAIDLFEDTHLHSYANKVLNIIAKLSKNVIKMPSMEALIDNGMLSEDIKEIFTNPIAKARINKAFRALGYSDAEISELIGANNFMTKEDSEELTDENRSFTKIWDWIKDPMKTDSKNTFKSGDEFDIKSIINNDDDNHNDDLLNAETDIDLDREYLEIENFEDEI